MPQDYHDTRFDVKQSVDLMKKPGFELAQMDGAPLDKKAQYMSETHGKFGPSAPQTGSNEMGTNLLKYCRQAHFELGSQGESLVSSKQLSYGVPSGPEAAKLNVGQMQDLKRVHYALGTDRDKPETQYTHEHKWIQPVNRASVHAS